jgi:chitin synthase
LCDPQRNSADRRNPGPLGAYLRGVEATAPLERLMYLAEDRVIGSEIMLSDAQPWRLEYAPEAIATTDGCLTFDELFRQRRRWRNSALVCRLWLLGQWWRFLLRKDRNPANKRSFSLAMAAQLLLVLRELFAPAQLVAVLAILCTVLTGASTQLGVLADRAICIAIPVDVALAWLPTGRLSAERSRIVLLVRRLWALVTAVLLILILMMSLPPGASALILSVLILVIPATLLTLPAGSLGVLMRAKYFPIMELAMVSLLSLYAFWNLHDVSWGTKGLRTCVADSRGGRRLRRWRNCFFSLWLASNCLLIAGALNWTGLLFPRLNPVFEVACLCDLLIVALALWYVIPRGRLAHSREHRPWRLTR